MSETRRRKRRAPQRASSQAAIYDSRSGLTGFRNAVVPSDTRFSKAESRRRYQARIGAAAAVPVVGYAAQAKAAQHGITDPHDRKVASRSQAGAALGGDAVGAYGGAKLVSHLAERHESVARGAEHLNTKINSLKATGRQKAGLPPKKLRSAWTGGGKAGQAVRAATKPLKTPHGAVGALIGGMTVGNVVSQANASHNYRRRVAKADPILPTRREAIQGAKRKRRRAAISTLSGGTGLAATGLLLAHRPEQAAKLGVIAGGIGGTNALYGAHIDRKEAKVVLHKGMPDQAALAVPKGALKAKTYTASALRRTPRGQLVRVNAGMR